MSKRSYDEARLVGDWESPDYITKKPRSHSTIRDNFEVIEALQDANEEIRKAKSDFQCIYDKYNNFKLKLEEFLKDYREIWDCQSLECVLECSRESQKITSLLWSICVKRLRKQADSLSDAQSQEVCSRISQLRKATRIGENELIEYESLSKQVDHARDANSSLRTTVKAQDANSGWRTTDNAPYKVKGLVEEYERRDGRSNKSLLC
jgi:hypothetical protein